MEKVIRDNFEIGKIEEKNGNFELTKKLNEKLLELDKLNEEKRNASN